MRKKRNDFDAVGVERMTDAELSKKLGGYQRTESISISLGVLLVIAGCISMFIQHDPILVCALAFRGIVVRCKDICDPTLDIALNDMFQERKKDDITDPAAFRKHFAAHTADGRKADDQVTPQLRDLVQKLEASSRTSKLCGLILRDGDLTLALNTRYVFAGVPEELDLRDIDGIRKWFTASLTGMGNLLDLITESPALTGGME